MQTCQRKFTLIKQILHHKTREMIVYQVLHAKKKLKKMLGLPRVGLLTVYCITIFLTEICTSHKIDRPKVLSTSQIFEARRGTTVTLPCTFNNLGTRSVIWLRGNQHSSKGADVVMELRKNRQGKLSVFEVYQPDIASGKLFVEGTSLVIHDLRVSDQDIYTCTLPSVPEESITHSLTVHESQECQSSQFRCDGICAETCDGIPECSDGSDETTQLCSNLACRREDSLGGLFGDNPALQKFKCKYGGCIALNFKCNGRSHCWDGSDETDDLCSSITCKRREVQCDYGGCIRGLWECDGKADCRDGSDETLERCKNTACPSRRPFKCAYGACIEERMKCNKIADCADDSDETKELCGSDHTFTVRSSSIVAIPKAETSPQTPPPPTQPPPTQPPPTQPPHTQPPPTRPPPTQPPPPSDPCRASSLCSCPGNGICVPCDRLDSCSSLLDGPKCSLPSDDIDTGITVDVLACGSQAFVNVAVFSRNHEALCSSKEVPTETVVMADCWGTATILAQCREDSKWHPYGNSLKDNTMEPSTELCQPRSINSLICGRRPRYRRPLIEFVSSKPQLQWPWLADIYRNFTYSCTATVISKDYLLTAAHCVTKSEESTVAVNLRTLIVHYLGVDGNIKSSYVNAVHIHPDYKGGSLPSRDIALLKLGVPVKFSHKVVPACVSTEGFPDLKIAATFDRKHPNDAIWETLLQKHDSRCHSPLDRCVSREIEADQFCAIDVDGLKSLPKGASGGPYLVNMGNDAKEKWTVAGVVSSSSGKFTCKQPFTIFSRASDFWTWIGSCAHRQACL